MNVATLRKILLLIIIVLIISVAWLSFQAFQATVNNQLTDTSGPVLRNAFFPKASSDGAINYYNGDTFVSYNTKTNTLSPLTSIRGVTDITNMYWTKNGVVFSVGSAAEWHPVWKMYETYTSQRDGDGDPDSYTDDSVLNNFHWYLSFKDNSVSLMSVGVDNAILYATPTDDGGLLYRDFPHYSELQPDGNIKTAVATLPTEENERRILKVSASEYVYITEKGSDIGVYSHSFTTNEDKELVKRLYSAEEYSIYSDISMTGNDIFYLVPTGQGSTRSVHVFNTSTKKSSKLIDSFQGTITTSASGDATAVHNGNEYTKLYTLTDMSKTVTITKPLAQPQFLLNASDMYYATKDGYIYKFGATATATATSPRPDVALEKKIEGGNRFVLERNIESTNDNSYTVTFATGKFTDRMNEVYKAVKDAGYDPFEFSFTPNPGPRVQY